MVRAEQPIAGVKICTIRRCPLIYRLVHKQPNHSSLPGSSTRCVLLKAAFCNSKNTFMKKVIFYLFLLVSAAPLFAQQAEEPQPTTRQDYLIKSRHQKTAAGILTGAGTAGLLSTLSAEASQALGGSLITLFSLGTVEPEYKSYAVPYLLSAAAVGGGIALFLAASKSKRRAREMDISSFLKMERAPVVQTAGRTMQAFPALAWRLRL